MGKRAGYFNGGEYYCSKCKHAHHSLSSIGKKHIGFAREEIKKEHFLKYGIC